MECKKCNHEYFVPDYLEDKTGLCNLCAQEAVLDLRRQLAESQAETHKQALGFHAVIAGKESQSQEEKSLRMSEKEGMRILYNDMITEKDEEIVKLRKFESEVKEWYKTTLDFLKGLTRDPR
jgi:hypothetical protein